MLRSSEKAKFYHTHKPEQQTIWGKEKCKKLSFKEEKRGRKVRRTGYEPDNDGVKMKKKMDGGRNQDWKNKGINKMTQNSTGVWRYFLG